MSDQDTASTRKEIYKKKNPTRKEIAEELKKAEYDLELSTSSSTDSMVETKWSFQREQHESPNVHNDDFTTKHLGYGIRIVIPCYLNKETTYVAEPVASDQRFSEMEKITLDREEKYCTDMYRLMEEYLDGAEKKTRPITFHPLYSEAIRVLMTINENPKSRFQFIAHLFANRRWSSIDFSSEREERTFQSKEIELLTVTKRLEVQTFDLTPDGYTFQYENDKDVQVIFPKDCVQQTVPIQIKILYPDSDDMRLRHTQFPSLHNLVAITPKIDVDHKNTTFHLPIEIRYALESFMQYEQDEHHLMRIRWHENDITITDEKHAKVIDGVVITEVTEFSGCASARFRKRNEALTSGRNDVQASFGEMHICTTIGFYLPLNEKISNLWCELAPIEKANEKIKERKKTDGVMHIPCSSAQDFYLTESEKVFVELTGNSIEIKHDKSRKKANYGITFHSRAERNHCLITLQKVESIDRSPVTEIVFRRSKGNKSVIYKFMWDLFRRPRKIPAPGPQPRRPDVNVQPNQLEENVVRDWFHEDRNLKAISNILENDDYLNIGVFLLLSSEEVEQIHQQYRPNMKSVIFWVLKAWLNKNERVDQQTKLDKFIQVLQDLSIDGNSIDIIRSYCEEGETLTNSVFR